MNKIWNSKGKVTVDTTKIQRIIRDYYKQPYANTMDNLEEMDKFLERYNLQRLNQDRNRKHEQTNQKQWNWNCGLKTFNKQKPRNRWRHKQILSNT